MASRQRLSSIALALLAILLAGAWRCAAAETEDVYAWIGGSGEGNVGVGYGSPETAEDQLFWLNCRNKEKASNMTVYVDIEGAKVGQPITIEFSAAAATASVKGKTATDEMSGFIFAEAIQFPVKPIIKVLKAKGPVTIKTGKTVTTLPEKGRAAELAEFAKACTLD